MRLCFLGDANSAHLRKWCRYLSRRGCDIHVISLTDGQIAEATVHNLGLDVAKVKTQGGLSKVNYLFQYQKARALVHRLKPDILHAHYATSYGLLGSLTGYHPYVISVWGSDVYDFPRKGVLHRKMLQYNLRRADYLLSTSKAMADETKKYTDKDLYITPFGVDLTVFRPLDSKGITQAAAQPERSTALVIGTVKALEPVYGIDYLIRAFAQVAANNPTKQLKLKIAGKGSAEQQLKHLCQALGIEGQVEFLGFLPQAQTVAAYNSFDIAVFPSLFESFGVAAVEAQACGLPVIVSDVGGLMESTKPGYSSIVVRRQNVTELAAALQQLIDNPELRRTMGQNGLNYVRTNFEVNQNFDHILNIYQNILHWKR